MWTAAQGDEVPAIDDKMDPVHAAWITWTKKYNTLTEAIKQLMYNVCYDINNYKMLQLPYDQKLEFYPTKSDCSQPEGLRSALSELESFHRTTRNSQKADTIQYLLLNKAVEERRQLKPLHYNVNLSLRKRQIRPRKKSTSWDMTVSSGLKFKFSKVQDLEKEPAGKQRPYKGFLRPELLELYRSVSRLSNPSRPPSTEYTRATRRQSRDKRRMENGYISPSAIDDEDGAGFPSDDADDEMVEVCDIIPSSPEQYDDDVADDENSFDGRFDKFGSMSLDRMDEIDQRLAEKEHLLQNLKLGSLAQITMEDVAPYLIPQIPSVPPLPPIKLPDVNALRQAVLPFAHSLNK